MSATPREAGRDQPAIETVAAGIAHAVRNPLNAVQINLRILEHELCERIPDRGAHVHAVLASIATELTSLDAFVAEFLHFARPPRLRIEQVPVRPLLTDLASFLGPECGREQVELWLLFDQGPTSVPADSFQLKHAVRNLVLNALQASPPGGKIEIRAGGDAERLLISVHDSGEGIPEHIRESVFTAFFTTREGATGLGLPIASRIAREHGGSLHIRSQPGEGTVATITLPARAGALDPPHAR
jgi:signal transduction histidine kinase